MGLDVTFSNCVILWKTTQIAKFMGPAWGPPGSCRPQMGPMLAPWTLLSGLPGFGNFSDQPCSQCQHNLHLNVVSPLIRTPVVALPHQNIKPNNDHHHTNDIGFTWHVQTYIYFSFIKYHRVSSLSSSSSSSSSSWSSLSLFWYPTTFSWANALHPGNTAVGKALWVFLPGSL